MDFGLLKQAIAYQVIGLLVTFAFTYAYFWYKGQPEAFSLSFEYAVLSFIILTIYYYVFNVLWKMKK